MGACWLGIVHFQIKDEGSLCLLPQVGYWGVQVCLKILGFSQKEFRIQVPQSQETGALCVSDVD